MKEIVYTDARPIDGYGPGFFRIGGVVHHGPVLASHAGVVPWGGIGDAAPLLALAAEVDVIFIGMGPAILTLPPELRAALDAAGIWVEAMSSPSAARTYNVLLAEGRRVAAALLPVGGAGAADPR